MVPVVVGHQYIDDAFSLSAGALHQFISYQTDAGAAVDNVGDSAVGGKGSAGGVAPIHIFQVIGKRIDKFPDVEFGERLKQGFVLEYKKLKNDNKLIGDELFDGLLDFASGKSNDFRVRAAGLAVLVYLFEACEVFEK